MRFAETDAQGVAHHAVYLVWFEIARVEYLARFEGGYPALREQGIEAMTRRGERPLPAAGALRRPARDRRRCLDVRGARFRFEYAVERGRGRCSRTAGPAHACVDAKTLRPTRVPAWLVEAIAAAPRR